MGLAMVINQPQEIQEDIQTLLATLRKLQDLQVSVELRAVLVSETFFERIGVDFNMNIQTPTSPTEQSLVTGNFVPAPFVNRVGQGVKLISGLTSSGTLTPDLNIPIRNSTFNFTTPQFGGYQPESGLSLGLAFLSDIQVFMFLEAVQGDRRAHIMQAPKVTVYNGQQAFISGTMNRQIVTQLTPVPLANGQLIMVPVTIPFAFGLGMQVQPAGIAGPALHPLEHYADSGGQRRRGHWGSHVQQPTDRDPTQPRGRPVRRRGPAAPVCQRRLGSRRLRRLRRT